MTAETILNNISFAFWYCLGQPYQFILGIFFFWAILGSIIYILSKR